MFTIVVYFRSFSVLIVSVKFVVIKIHRRRGLSQLKEKLSKEMVLSCHTLK